MKKIYLMFMLIGITFYACQEEEEMGNVSFPPTVLSIFPGDKANVPKGDFNVSVFLIDGKGSPLSTGTLIMKDSAGNELFSVEKQLTGTKDSIIVEGSVFSAADLQAGNYTLLLNAKDVNGLTTNRTISFKIVDALYSSIESEMYVAGEFNGWGSDALTLVGNNTWEIQNVNLMGGQWKLKNTVDWSDTDWGDPGCDGVMEVTSGGGPNTNCGHSGMVNIRFNDATLAYTVIPVGGGSTFEQNVTNLYILGNFNDFEGDDFRMTLVDNNTWEFEEVRLKPSDKFKFSEGSHFQPKVFGDAGFDGQAEEHGPYIVIPDTWDDAYYKVTFDDETLIYTIEFVRFPYPSQLFLVGGSTAAGWTPGDAAPFIELEDGKFEIYSYLTVAGDGFKFLEVQDWPGDWGSKPDTRAVDNGSVSGELVQDGEQNVTVDADGFYRITVNFIDGEYEVKPFQWAVIGSARTGSDSDGWNDPDSDMTLVGDVGSYTWTIDIHLFAGALKFRANDNWDVNLGDTGVDSSLEYGGDNIAISEEGDYTIELMLDPSGYTYTVTKH